MSDEAQCSVQDLCLVSWLLLVHAVRGQEGEQRLWCLGRVGGSTRKEGREVEWGTRGGKGHSFRKAFQAQF